MRKLWCVLLFLLLAPAAAPAGTLVDPQIGFSAERILVIDGQSYQGKIWAMPGRERHEQAIHGMRPVFLFRADVPLAQAVLNGLKTIVQFEIPPELRHLDRNRLKRRPLGSDTINGVATTKYRVDERVADGHAEGTLWLSRNGIPMRADGTFTSQQGRVSTIRWELSNVKIGPQPAALFEPPQGYSKLPPEAVAPLLGLKLKPSRRGD